MSHGLKSSVTLPKRQDSIEGVRQPRILIVVNAEWYFLSHRLSLAKALQSQGCEVLIAAAVERGHQATVENEGFRFIPLQLQRRSIAPWREVFSLLELFRLYRREQPDVVHHITIKPVIYGSLMARVANVPAVINTIPGLGYAFLGEGVCRKLVRTGISQAYKLTLAGKNVLVIFQNTDDRNTFVSNRLIDARRAILIRSSGVDVHRFAPSPQPKGIPIILLASRLLWDKGVGELVDASRRLKVRGIPCRVVLVGVPDNENRNSIPASTLEAWQAEQIIEWWGLRHDMPDVLKGASIAALPSYYPEGVPKFLLEAAASGRPIVTTDTQGCREIVRHGQNGLLVPARDSVALAEVLETMLRDPNLRERMGARGREIAINEFSEEKVIRETLDVYRDLLGARWPRPMSDA